MKIPTQYPDTVLHHFYFQQILPVFNERVWLEKDPATRYQQLDYLLHDCFAIDLLEVDDIDMRDNIENWALDWARLVATAFRSAKLYGHNAFDLLDDFKQLVSDHNVEADQVWLCHSGFAHPDGTEITEIGDFFEKALVDASDSEKEEGRAPLYLVSSNDSLYSL